MSEQNCHSGPLKQIPDSAVTVDILILIMGHGRYYNERALKEFTVISCFFSLRKAVMLLAERIDK